MMSTKTFFCKAIQLICFWIWNKKYQVTVLHKKAASTLIDDCIDKFRQHEVERKRLRLLNGQRGSTEGAPVEFLIGEDADPLSAALNQSLEDPKSPGVEDMTGGGGKSIMRIED